MYLFSGPIFNNYIRNKMEKSHNEKVWQLRDNLLTTTDVKECPIYIGKQYAGDVTGLKALISGIDNSHSLVDREYITSDQVELFDSMCAYMADCMNTNICLVSYPGQVKINVYYFNIES